VPTVDCWRGAEATPEDVRAGVTEGGLVVVLSATTVTDELVEREEVLVDEVVDEDVEVIVELSDVDELVVLDLLVVLDSEESSSNFPSSGVDPDGLQYRTK